ncbi:MAG: caspase family protein [Nitrospirales bacterium]|nr:caspase family protein [Nitrospirales bacterium]
MKRCPFFPTLILLFIVVLFVGHTLIVAMPSAFGAGAPSVKRALLIGIGKYQVLPRLPGSKNDIDLVHQVLLSRYGFAEQDIHIIRDEAATRDGVLAGLHRIATEAGPNDVVYIHYSGHGSQVEDLNGDEPDDQLDETIVPADGRTEGVPDITDDELDEILSQLKTSKAVVVLDSCHSGTATRGLEVRVRSVPADRRVNLYKKGGVSTRAIVPVNLHSYVLFSGAASHEEALDGPVDGRYHGFFTHSLFKSLQSSPMNASTREIFSGAKQELKRIQNQFGRTSMPEPQLEASKARMELPFFSAPGEPPGLMKELTGSARRSWVAVQPQTGNHVQLVNALALGADPGSVWGIYPEGEVAFEPAKAQAFAVVQATDGQNAVAVISPKQAEVSSKSRAVLVAPASESKAIPVALRNVPPVQAKQLKELLGKQMGDVKFVGDQEFARFIVESRGDGLHVLSADGTRELMSLPAQPGTQAIAALSQVLVQSRNASQLLNLENPSSQMSVSVRVVQVGERGIAVVSDTMEAPVYHIRKANEPRSLSNSLQLEVTSDTDAYITIVDVDAEGNVNVLFPNSYQNPRYYPDGFIKAGRTVLLPDSLQSGNQAGFHFDYANPPGVDTIRVFASTTSELAQRIRQAVEGGNTQGFGGRSQVASSLAHLASLRQELVGSVTRGLITVPDDSVAPVSQPIMSTVEQAPLAMVDQLPPKNSMSESIGYIQDRPAESFSPDPSMPGGMNTEQTMDSHLDAQTMPVGLPVSDWTAVSVTVLIQP